ncbi:hypothetical protein BPAE_0320g00090 [Botrytis paeoniae]|uniref:Uncharacterized protein n=1 Tax=Botrytis paeoniae TaxID=278948 RepID=A0A4Z1FFM7_9HELO|nr:hypothetical protein BPAE_0320g00090 [Botrytis paeoniae]
MSLGTSKKDKFIEFKNIMALTLPNRIKVGIDAMQANAINICYRSKSYVKDHAYHLEDCPIEPDCDEEKLIASRGGFESDVCGYGVHVFERHDV